MGQGFLVFVHRNASQCSGYVRLICFETCSIAYSVSIKLFLTAACTWGNKAVFIQAFARP